MPAQKKNVKYTKDNSTVVKMTEKAHKSFSKQILKSAAAKGINKNQMTKAIDASAPMTYHMLDPKQNITLNTMCRYAAALGMEVEIKLTDPAVKEA